MGGETRDTEPRSGTVREVDDSRYALERTALELRRRLSFEQRLSSVSTMLLHQDSGASIDEQMRLALRAMADTFGAQRISVWAVYDAPTTSGRRLYYWSPDGVIHGPDRISAAELPGMAVELLAQKPIVLEDIGAIPQGADRRMLERFAQGSLVLMPVGSHRGVRNVLVLASSAARAWPDLDLKDLRLMGEALAAAIARNLALSELRESEARYRRVVESQTEFVMRWRPGGIRTFVNEAYRKYYGSACEGLIGSSFFSLIDPADLPRIQAAIDALTPDQPVHEGIHRAPRPDGSVAWQKWVDRAFFDDDGKLIEYQSVGHDITELMETQQQLRAKAEHQRLVANVSTSLLTATPENFAQRLEAAFERIAIAHRLELVELCWAEPDGLSWKRTHSWSIHGALPNVRFESIAGVEKVLDGAHIVISPRDWLLESASGSPVFDAVRCLAIPSRFRDRLISVCAFSVTDLRRWFDEDVIEQLTSLSVIITSAHNRVTATAQLQEASARLEAENVCLREAAGLPESVRCIIGESPALKETLALVGRVAPADTTVLILGETGTGKELIARTIHELSPRSKRPMVSVNCAALPSQLIESELFGHEKGAFSGATARRKGRFELADGGTLFLDEVGELPHELQATLLRVLQEGDFERVGGSERLEVDVRIVAATNRDLELAVSRGDFREDLYYRLNAFPIRMPPLRERPEDVPVLARFFLQRFAKRFGREFDTISSRFLRYIENHTWPGNVRELDGFIQRAVISSTGSVLDLPPGEPGLKSVPAPVASASEQREGSGAERHPTLQQIERNHIVATLESVQWVIEGPKGAAAKLGMRPSTLRSKMKRHGVSRARGG